MRQSHKAGEKCFVNYCGQTVPIVCAQTGEIRPAQIFVAVLGASNYTYAEATWTQSLPDWLGSHVRAFEYFGGSTMIVVPDNLKSGVSRACRYDPDPDLNPSYQRWAEHYQVALAQCFYNDQYGCRDSGQSRRFEARHAPLSVRQYAGCCHISDRLHHPVGRWRTDRLPDDPHAGIPVRLRSRSIADQRLAIRFTWLVPRRRHADNRSNRVRPYLRGRRRIGDEDTTRLTTDTITPCPLTPAPHWPVYLG